MFQQTPLPGPGPGHQDSVCRGEADTGRSVHRHPADIEGNRSTAAL